MLFSNVAAWIHVGCCEQASEKQVADVPGRCCQHSCSAANANDGPADDSPDGGPAPASEHDSDSCHVCQTFHVSRHAVVATGDAILWTTAATGHLRLERDDAPCEDLYRTELSVRGPPSV